MKFEYDQRRRPVAQGDVMIVPIKAVPSGAEIEEAENGRYIITHSETGHHHVIAERPGVRVFKGMDTLTGFLSLSEEALLEHLRSYDTHAPIALPPGDYIIKRQRQFGPEGWQRAAD